MKELIKYFLPWVIVFILGWIIIAKPTFIFSPEYRTEVVTDTLYINKPFEVTIYDTKEIEVPRIVTIYETVRDTIIDVRVETDTVFISVNNGQTILYHSNFLTQFPRNPKLLGGSLSYSTVEFVGLFPINGITQSVQYAVDYNRYRYNIGITERGDFALKRERLGLRDRISNSYYNEVFLGYNFMDNSPTLQYRTGLSNIYQKLGIEGQVELSTEIQTKVGLNYRF